MQTIHAHNDSALTETFESIKDEYRKLRRAEDDETRLAQLTKIRDLAVIAKDQPPHDDPDYERLEDFQQSMEELIAYLNETIDAGKAGDVFALDEAGLKIKDMRKKAHDTFDVGD